MEKIKSYFVIFIFFLFIFSMILFPNSEINWISYDDALNLSKKTNKFIFLYFWTESCPYCNKMKNITLSNKEVINYLNENFHSVSINANSNSIASGILNKTGNSLASQYMIQGVPTSIFLKPNGEVLYNIPGYIEYPNFLLILKYINTRSYEKMNFNDFKKSNQ
ncbi:MAG: thioredoxin fold domain-containing protein [Spirochaetes bacterium]|nr:thioredoxin fold domain-containing protein [Spirochaetota bacterium]